MPLKWWKIMEVRSAVAWSLLPSWGCWAAVGWNRSQLFCVRRAVKAHRSSLLNHYALKNASKSLLYHYETLQAALRITLNQSLHVWLHFSPFIYIGSLNGTDPIIRQGICVSRGKLTLESLHERDIIYICKCLHSVL
jgi:hypothetical protein